MSIGKGEYQYKSQTPEHKAKMKKLCEEIFDTGVTPDEIIDAGDYLLNEMSLKELLGEKEDVKEKSTKQQGKASAAKSTSKSSKSSKKSGKSKDKKSKDKKSKSKKSKK